MLVTKERLTARASAFFTVAVWALIAAVLVRIAIGEQYQWDLRVFHAAPAALENGVNPYEKNSPALAIPPALSYLYPPLLLYVFKPLSNLPYSTAHLLWFVLKLGALGALLLLWHRHFERLHVKWPLALFFLFAFKSALLRDITAGNIAIFEQLGLWAAFYCILIQRPYVAGAIIAVTAQAKLMPVVFLGLLLICGPARSWRPFVASLALFTVLLALNYVLMPEMSEQYLRALGSSNPNLDERGEINPCSLAMLRDAAAFLASLGVPLTATFVNSVYLLYVAAVGIAVLFAWLKYKERLSSVDPKLLIYFACVLFTLTMPRVKDYTYILLLIPTLFVIRHVKIGPSVPLLAVFLFLPPSVESYVPGLGMSFLRWLQAYSPWIIAWFLLPFLWEEIRRAAVRPLPVASREDSLDFRQPLAERPCA